MKNFYSLIFGLCVSAMSLTAMTSNASSLMYENTHSALATPQGFFKSQDIKNAPVELASRIKTTPIQSPMRAAQTPTSLSDGEPVSVTFEAIQQGGIWMYNGGVFLVNNDDYAVVWLDEENPLTLTVAAGTYDVFCIFSSNNWKQPIFYVDYQEGVAISEGTTITVSPLNATEHIYCDYKLLNGETPISHYSLDNGESYIEKGNVDGTIYWLGLTHPATGLLTNMSTYAEFLSTQDTNTNEICSIMISPCTNNPMKFYQCFMAYDKDSVIGSGCEFDNLNSAVTKTVAADSYQEMDFPIALSPNGQEIGDFVYAPGYVMTPVIEGAYSSTMSFDCHKTLCSMEHRYFSFPKTNDIENTFFAYNPVIVDTETHMFGELYFLRSTLGRPVMPVNGTMTMIDHLGDHAFNHDIAGDIFSLAPIHSEFSWPVSSNMETLGNSAPIAVFYINAEEYLEINRQYRGINNELRPADLDAGNLYVKYNGEVVCDDPEYLEEWAECDWSIEDNIGEYEFGFYNDNVVVDGIPGYNKMVAYSDFQNEKRGVPSLSRLAFKNDNGAITNRFSAGEHGILMFSGADYEFEMDFSNGYHWGFIPYEMNVEVEYAPYGKDNFSPLTVERDETLDRDAYGYFYKASLADVTASSENGWYALRFTLTDADGNKMEQEITPAFKIDSTLQDPVISSIPRLETFTEDTFEYYNLQGMRISNPQSGIYIAISGSNSKKVVLP